MIQGSIKRGLADIEFEGSITELTAECVVLIRTIHNGLFEKDIKAAMTFRELMIMSVNREDAPTFRYDYDKEGN